MLHGTPKKTAEYIPVGRVWPSGEFSLGYRRGPVDGRVDLDTFETWHREGALDATEAWGVGRYGVPVPPEASWFHDWENDGLTRFLDSGEALDLTSGPNSHSKPNRPENYGKNGMTGYGRRMVRSACALLERSYKGRLTFCTITMPPLERELRVELAECWPEFVRQLLQWLTRCLVKQELPAAICSVSEIQPRRLQAGNGGYLHLHMVWPNRIARKGRWAIDTGRLRSWVESFLSRRGFLPEGSWANVDTKRVTKSAAAYLSKYMSKSGDTLAEFVEDCGWSAVPGQWWNMTKVLRDAVKAELVEGDEVGAILDSMVNYSFHCDDFEAFWSLRHVDLELDGKLFTVGYTGTLKDDVRKDLLKMLDRN